MICSLTQHPFGFESRGLYVFIPVRLAGLSTVEAIPLGKDRQEKELRTSSLVAQHHAGFRVLFGW